jgi:hypothetical protein
VIHRFPRSHLQQQSREAPLEQQTWTGIDSRNRAGTPSGRSNAMKRRRRFRHYIPLQDRLAAFVRVMRQRAELIPPGSRRDEMLEKAKTAELWANSPGLRLPK